VRAPRATEPLRLALARGGTGRVHQTDVRGPRPGAAGLTGYDMLAPPGVYTRACGTSMREVRGGGFTATIRQVVPGPNGIGREIFRVIVIASRPAVVGNFHRKDIMCKSTISRKSYRFQSRSLNQHLRECARKWEEDLQKCN
jgi:hypothetical protein